MRLVQTAIEGPQEALGHWQGAQIPEPRGWGVEPLLLHREELESLRNRPVRTLTAADGSAPPTPSPADEMALPDPGPHWGRRQGAGLLSHPLRSERLLGVSSLS